MGHHDYKPLPKKVIDGIFKYRVEHRQELYQDILFDKYAEIQWFDEERKDEVGCWDDPKEWNRFINRCVEVYIDD